MCHCDRRKLGGSNRNCRIGLGLNGRIGKCDSLCGVSRPVLSWPEFNLHSSRKISDGWDFVNDHSREGNRRYCGGCESGSRKVATGVCARRLGHWWKGGI
jgi:hypothetical protein